MSEKFVRFCDECGTERKEVNNWFCAIVSEVNGLTSFCTFEEAGQTNSGRYDFCGQKCAGDAFHRLLNTGSVAKPTTIKGADAKEES